jgi:hypothetical protein
MAYIVPETGELSTTAITDSYAYLVDTARCVIQAGHAFAPLLTDTAPGRRGQPGRGGVGGAAKDADWHGCVVHAFSTGELLPSRSDPAESGSRRHD